MSFFGQAAVPWCSHCWGEDSAAFGYGYCPVCGGIAAIERLEMHVWEVKEDLEGEIEHRDSLLDERDLRIAQLLEVDNDSLGG